VKLTSPYLNVLIICGVIMLYVDVILFGIDEGTPTSRCSVNALCMVRTTIVDQGEGVTELDCGCAYLVLSILLCYLLHLVCL